MLEFDPLDEYPIHQVAAADALRRDAATATCTTGASTRASTTRPTRTSSPGMGVYPNLGVIDAYATVRRGDKQWAVRTSGRVPTTSMSQQVGPYRIEVIKPFHELRLICDADDHGLGFDLDVPLGVRADLRAAAHPPPGRPHPARRVARSRASARGRASCASTATRSRSRPTATPRPATARGASVPSAKPEPAGPAATSSPACGGAGSRCASTTSRCTSSSRRTATACATRTSRCACWPEATGRGPEQLGWPLPEIRYTSGTRNPIGASIELTNRDGKTSTLEIEPMIGIPLNVGCGYGADPDWTHGVWKGDDWVEGSVYDYNDPAVSGPRRVLVVGPRRARDVRRPRRVTASSSTAASAPTPHRLHRHDPGRALTHSAFAPVRAPATRGRRIALSLSGRRGPGSTR